jgi:hypothetical protein
MSEPMGMVDVYFTDSLYHSNSFLHPILDLDLVGPAEGMKFGDIDAFARGAVRLGGIETNLSLESDSLDYQVPTTP